MLRRIKFEDLIKAIGIPLEWVEKDYQFIKEYRQQVAKEKKDKKNVRK